MENDYSVGAGFPFGMLKMFWNWVLHHSGCTKSHSIVYFKMVKGQLYVQKKQTRKALLYFPPLTTSQGEWGGGRNQDLSRVPPLKR